MFEGVDVVFLRSNWDSPQALWIGVMGGDNKANHSHLDLGSFVLDSGGTRFALDLGSDDYNMPDYFGSKRFTYYRLRTESHNTVLIDDENQDPKAVAPMTMDGVFTIDLKAAYPGKVTRFTRTVMIGGEDRTTTIRNDIEAPQPVSALWGMVTDARIVLDHASSASPFCRRATAPGTRFGTSLPPWRRPPESQFRNQKARHSSIGESDPDPD